MIHMRNHGHIADIVLQVHQLTKLIDRELDHGAKMCLLGPRVRTVDGHTSVQAGQRDRSVIIQRSM